MYLNKEGGNSVSQLQSIASTFGMASLTDSESSYNIPDIIKSRLLNTKILYNQWKTQKYEIPSNLLDYWNINQEDKLSADEDGLNLLNERISVQEDKTGLIRVSVLMEEPELSASIVNFIFDEVVDFTKNNKLDYARQNTQFILKRSDEVKLALEKAVNSLKYFREQNRLVTDSPQLQLELERLLREVEIQTEVFITIQQQYELARIEQMREEPSILILDKGYPASKKYSPRRTMILLSSLIIGLFISSAYILVRKNFIDE